MVDEVSQTKHDKDTPLHPHLSLATGLLAVAMAVVGLLTGFQLKSDYPFEHNFHDKIDSPVLALELSTDVQDLYEVLHTKSPGQANQDTGATKAVSSLRTNTYEDFFFIPLYTSFLGAFVLLFATGTRRRHVAQRRAIVAIVILIAAFDCAENVGILRTLGASSISRAMAQATCWPSRGKWGLFAVALLFTGWITEDSSSLLYSLATRRLLALAYGAASILMLIGLMKPHVIELATTMFALLSIINIVALLGPYIEKQFLRAQPPEYVDDFCNRKARMQADVAVFPSTPSGA